MPSANSLSLCFAVAAIACGATVRAADGERFPSHCLPAEHVYLNARMGSIELTTDFSNDKNGRILSVCADRIQEPIESIVVRYGVLGKPELEYKGSSKSRVRMFFERTAPSMGEEVLFFSAGNRTHYVIESVGLAHGVRYYVFEGKKLVKKEASGLNLGSDYEHGEVRIDFYKVSSQVFIQSRPWHNW